MGHVEGEQGETWGAQNKGTEDCDEFNKIFSKNSFDA